MTVWKFFLDVALSQDVAMPAGATILLVAPQDGVLCLWAQVDPAAPLETRKFYVTGTGHTCPEFVDHIGSVVMLPFVWHVWEAVA